MTKTRKRFKFKSLTVFLIFMTLSVLLLIPIVEEIATTISLKQSLDEVSTKLKTLSAETTQLTIQRDKLLDPDYVISYARGVYMLSKDTDKVYYFKDTTTK